MRSVARPCPFACESESDETGVIPENLPERLALWCGIPPPGIVESWLGIMASRAVLVATKLDIFETLAAGPLTVQEIVDTCATHRRATEQLLNALVGMGCLQLKGGRYALARRMRAWILAEGKYSFRGQILLHELEWKWWEHCEDYVRTGQPLRVHQTMTDEEWGLYQRGMRSGSAFPANWVARNLPLPKTARTMLDIGGSHGFFSVAICRRYPTSRSRSAAARAPAAAVTRKGPESSRARTDYDGTTHRWRVVP